MQATVKVFLFEWRVMPVLLLLPIYGIHLIQCILNLFILLSTHIRANLGVVCWFIRSRSQFEVKIDTRSELIYINSVFRWLIQVRDVRCSRHEPIVILIRCYRTIGRIVIRVLRWALPIATVRPPILKCSNLIWSDRWGHYRLTLHRILYLVWWTTNNGGSCLWLSITLRLSWTLQLFHVDSASLLFTLSRSTVVWCWGSCLTNNVVSFTHERVLLPIVRIVLGLLLTCALTNWLISWPVNNILAIGAK